MWRNDLILVGKIEWMGAYVKAKDLPLFSPFQYTSNFRNNLSQCNIINEQLGYHQDKT